jgi:hypothetical protein
MLQEIFCWIIALLIVAGFWRVGVLIAGIAQRQKIRRIQRGIAEYLRRKTAAKA